MREPWVSDHAAVRYLERACGVTPEEAQDSGVTLADVKREILTPGRAAAIRAGATKIRHKGIAFVVKNGTVVTVLTKEKTTMPKIVPLRERDEAPELAPHRKADPEFFCYELKVGSEVHFRRRNGEMSAYRVWGFRKVERSTRMAKHNQRVHPKDTIILKEIGVAKTFREVGAQYIENWSRWGLVRDEE